MARYATNTRKALETILWLAHRKPGIDIYTLVKVAFFADKQHLQAHGRPIVGDAYEAAPYGPLAQVIYGILRHKPIELIALHLNGPLPFRVEMPGFRVEAERDANADHFSKSDLDTLGWSLETYGAKSFDELFKLSHDDPAYEGTKPGAVIDYVRFLDEDDPAFEEKAADIEETASHAVL